MENSRLRKTTYNISSLLLYQVANFVCNLILPRLIINTYGSAYNGIILSITQFLNFVSILRLGVAGATRVSLYKTLALKDVEGTSKVVRTTEKYMQKIGYVILVYMFVLAVLYPKIIDVEYSFWSIFLLVILLGMGTFGQYFFGLTYQTLLEADQRQYIYNIIQTLSVILNTAISSTLIACGASIQIVKLFSAFLFMASPFVLSRYVIRRYRLDRKCAVDSCFLSQRRDAMGHSIANIVHENTDVIVLTLFCNVKIVSVYSVYALVMNGLKQVLQVFTTGSEAVFGNMWAKGEKESIAKNMRIFEYMIGVFVSIIFSGTLLLLLPFVSLYTRNVTDVEYILPIYATVITCAQAFFCMRFPYLVLVQAAGKYKETKKGAYIEAAINLLLSLILVNFVGIVGTGLGTLAANVFRTMHYSIFSSRELLNRKYSEVVKRFVWVTCNVLVILGCCVAWVNKYAYLSWSAWVISGIICVIIAVIVTGLSSVVFYRNDMLALLSLLERMINSRK